MTWLMSSLRRLRIERTAALGLTILVFVTAFAFALAPRVLDTVADRALRDEVAGAAPVERNLQLLGERRVNPDPRGAMAGVEAVGERYEAQLPASVRAAIAGRAYLAESSRWKLVSEATTEHFTTLRFEPDLDDRITVVAGRLPVGGTTTIPGWSTEAEGGGEAAFGVSVFEVALAVPSAAEVGARVGDTIRLELDPSDRLNTIAAARPGPASRIALRVVGLYRVDDPEAPYWLGDTALAAPVLRAVNSEVQFWDVAALAAPEAYESFLGLTAEQELPLQYAWRYYVDPARLDAERADALVADLRRLESVFPTSQTAAQAGEGIVLRSGLLRLVETQRAGWHSAEAVLAVVAVGPAAVALAALALVVLLVERRRRPGLVLQRGRGASTTQLLGAATFEGLLLVVPAAALAVALATALVPSGPTTPTILAAVAVTGVALVLLVGLTVPASRLARTSARAAGPTRTTGARRLAFEGMIVGLAIVGAVLLRSRGVQGASSTGGLATPDPFIAAVPALLGLAAALIAMRLYPLAMRAVAALAGWRRDLVPALALRQAARGGTGGPILLVLLATVALGAFSSATLVHLDRAADAVAWQETGAAFRLSGSWASGRLPTHLEDPDLPGVQASARATRLSAVYAPRAMRVTVLAVDVPAYQQVAAGTPVEPVWPVELRGPAAAPMPVIVSSDLAVGPDALAVGDRPEVTIEGRQVVVRVVEVRPTFPSIPAGDPFLVLSREQLESALPGLVAASTDVFLRAPDTAQAAIAEALGSEAGGVALGGRAARAAELRASPVVEAVTVGVAVAAVLALAYAGLAVAASLALSGAARAGQVAILRTLGLTGRQSFGLVVVEHGPTVIVAFVAGTVLGLGLFAVLRPGLGLGTVVGSPLDIPLSVDPGQLLLLLLGIIAIVAVSIGLAGALQRSLAPVDALRRGTE